MSSNKLKKTLDRNKVFAVPMSTYKDADGKEHTKYKFIKPDKLIN